jgi:hypothetical protein
MRGGQSARPRRANDLRESLHAPADSRKSPPGLSEKFGANRRSAKRGHDEAVGLFEQPTAFMRQKLGELNFCSPLIGPR